MPAEFRASEDGFRRFAEIASGIGEKLAAAGLSFSYHNHSFEFVKFGGRSGLDLLFAESDERYLQAELDTYWIQHGGADPVEWIERVTARMPVVHLKDMVMMPDEVGGRPQQTMAEIGEGNMISPASWRLVSEPASNGMRSSRISASATPLRAWQSATEICGRWA